MAAGSSVVGGSRGCRDGEGLPVGSRVPATGRRAGSLRVLLDAGRRVGPSSGCGDRSRRRSRPATASSGGGPGVADTGNGRRRAPKRFRYVAGERTFWNTPGVEAQVRLALVAQDHDRLAAVVAQPQPGVAADDVYEHAEHVRLDGETFEMYPLPGNSVRAPPPGASRSRSPECSDGCAVYRGGRPRRSRQAVCREADRVRTRLNRASAARLQPRCAVQKL